MSFILDALKKAEAERHQRVAPVLMDARIAPPRRGLPTWAWLLGAVLLVNLVLLGIVLWRSPAAPVGVPEQRAAADAGSAAAPAPLAAAVPAPTAAAPVAPAVTPALPGATPVAPVTSGTAATPALPVAPARPSAATAPAFESLPTLHELSASGVALPDLQLQLHAYSQAPQERSVLLNGQRLREGEYTPNGVKVERITPTGVVLEASGRSFRLEAGF